MRQVVFHAKAFSELLEWASQDMKKTKKIFDLIENTQRTPFEGLGKPEPLKYDFQGCWSRRIDDEHRLVYSVTDESIIIISCRYHYI
jgi:toxin YoeB